MQAFRFPKTFPRISLISLPEAAALHPATENPTGSLAAPRTAGTLPEQPDHPPPGRAVTVTLGKPEPWVLLLGREGIARGRNLRQRAKWINIKVAGLRPAAACRLRCARNCTARGSVNAQRDIKPPRPRQDHPSLEKSRIVGPLLSLPGWSRQHRWPCVVAGTASPSQRCRCRLPWNSISGPPMLFQGRRLPAMPGKRGRGKRRPEGDPKEGRRDTASPPGRRCPVKTLEAGPSQEV